MIFSKTFTGSKADSSSFEDPISGGDVWGWEAARPLARVSRCFLRAATELHLCCRRSLCRPVDGPEYEAFDRFEVRRNE